MIGDLDRRVTLERPDRVEDDGGGFATTWTPVVQVWAFLSSSTAGEGEVGDGLTARVSHALRLRWRDDVEPGWRVTFDGRVLRVRAAVDREGAKRWVHLHCEEEVR